MFKKQFPEHYALYSKTMQYLRTRHPNLSTPWGVFSGLAVNSGGSVATTPHTDSKNYPAGLCAIIPYGRFDFTRSAFLCCDLGGNEYRLAVAPGIPTFIPSALVTHWNSKIVGLEEYRGSLVYWMAGSLVRYMELDGRMVSKLRGQAKADWDNGLEDRCKAAMKLWPQN